MDIPTPITFAIVGYGNQGRRHAEAIGKIGKLIAIVDTKEIEAEVPIFQYVYQLKELKPDVVCICTPNGVHAKHALQALGVAEYVIIEKPVGLEDVSVLSLYKDRIFCVMQNRFTPAAQWLKSLDYGQVYSVHINCFWNRGRNYYEESEWRGTKRLDGGALFTQFSHFIDILYWLFGKPEIVSAMVENKTHDYIETDDSGAFMFSLPNGSTGTFNYSNNCTSNMESSITIISEKGTVKVGGQYMQKVEHCEGFERPDLSEPVANGYNGYKGSANNISYVIENAARHIIEGEPIATTIDEGIEIVNIINKIYSYGMLWNKGAKADKTTKIENNAVGANT